MTADKARKRAIRERAAAAGISYTAARYSTDRRSDVEQRPMWSGIDWYAFPPEPPKGCRLGVPQTTQRWYWTGRRQWAWRAPDQVPHHARMAADLHGRAHHLTQWWPEGHVYYGRTRALAIEVLYTIATHDWPDLVPDAAALAELVAAGEPAPVDAAFADLDRHARLLTDTGYQAPTMELVEQARAILRSQADNGRDQRTRRYTERVLALIHRATTPYDTDPDSGYPIVEGISMPGALNTLDAMLCSSQGGLPPGTVVRYQDGDSCVLAQVDQCVWSPTGGAPTHYALHWFRDYEDHRGSRRGEHVVPAGEVRLPPGTAAPWMASKRDGLTAD